MICLAKKQQYRGRKLIVLHCIIVVIICLALLKRDATELKIKFPKMHYCNSI